MMNAKNQKNQSSGDLSNFLVSPSTSSAPVANRQHSNNEIGKTVAIWIIGVSLGILCFPIVIVFAPFVLIYVIIRK